MDVHPTKNGIYRYWPIPIYIYTSHVYASDHNGVCEPRSALARRPTCLTTCRTGHAPWLVPGRETSAKGDPWCNRGLNMVNIYNIYIYISYGYETIIPGYMIITIHQNHAVYYIDIWQLLAIRIAQNNTSAVRIFQNDTQSKVTWINSPSCSI